MEKGKACYQMQVNNLLCQHTNCFDNGKITIGNYRLGDDGFYIGRAMPRYALSRSILANPYKIKDLKNKDEILLKYKQWLWLEIKKQDEIWQLLNQMADLIIANRHVQLVCWCKSEMRKENKPCHGDVIRDAVKWIIREREKKG